MSRNCGLETLERRIDSIPHHLREAFDSPLPGSLVPPGVNKFVTTGIGSSEAHARYLAVLLNRSGVCSAEFLPTVSFYGLTIQPRRDTHLFVFSQGLSPNARIALNRRDRFAGMTLVTSSTAEGQRQAGKEDRASLLDTLQREGVSIIRYPMENEFEILPRVVGPICGYLTSWRIAESLGAPMGSLQLAPLLNPNPESTLPDTQSLNDCSRELLEGTDFYFTNSTSLYAQNLSAKVLETVFRPPPRIRDVIDFAHGPFQANRVEPGHSWIFTADEPEEADLLDRLGPLFGKIENPTVVVSPLPEPLAIFFYEHFLNRVVLQAAKAAGHDLVNWPGKGEDGEGYSLHQPYGPNGNRKTSP